MATVKKAARKKKRRVRMHIDSIGGKENPAKSKILMFKLESLPEKRDHQQQQGDEHSKEEDSIKKITVEPQRRRAQTYAEMIEIASRMYQSPPVQGKVVKTSDALQLEYRLSTTVVGQLSKLLFQRHQRHLKENGCTQPLFFRAPVAVGGKSVNELPNLSTFKLVALPCKLADIERLGMHTVHAAAKQLLTTHEDVGGEQFIKERHGRLSDRESFATCEKLQFRGAAYTNALEYLQQQMLPVPLVWSPSTNNSSALESDWSKRRDIARGKTRSNKWDRFDTFGVTHVYIRNITIDGICADHFNAAKCRSRFGAPTWLKKQTLYNVPVAVTVEEPWARREDFHFARERRDEPHLNLSQKRFDRLKREMNAAASKFHNLPDHEKPFAISDAAKQSAFGSVQEFNRVRMDPGADNDMYINADSDLALRRKVRNATALWTDYLQRALEEDDAVSKMNTDDDHPNSGASDRNRQQHQRPYKSRSQFKLLMFSHKDYMSRFGRGKSRNVPFDLDLSTRSVKIESYDTVPNKEENCAHVFVKRSPSSNHHQWQSDYGSLNTYAGVPFALDIYDWRYHNRNDEPPIWQHLEVKPHLFQEVAVVMAERHKELAAGMAWTGIPAPIVRLVFMCSCASNYEELVQITLFNK